MLSRSSLTMLMSLWICVEQWGHMVLAAQASLAIPLSSSASYGQLYLHGSLIYWLTLGLPTMLVIWKLFVDLCLQRYLTARMHRMSPLMALITTISCWVDFSLQCAFSSSNPTEYKCEKWNIIWLDHPSRIFFQMRMAKILSHLRKWYFPESCKFDCNFRTEYINKYVLFPY